MPAIHNTDEATNFLMGRCSTEAVGRRINIGANLNVLFIEEAIHKYPAHVEIVQSTGSQNLRYLKRRKYDRDKVIL
jgi:hypothetical protein